MSRVVGFVAREGLGTMVRDVRWVQWYKERGRMGVRRGIWGDCCSAIEDRYEYLYEATRV